MFELSIPDELFIHWRKQAGNSKPTEENPGNTRLPKAPLAPGETEDSNTQLIVDFTDLLNGDNYEWQGDHSWLRMVVDTGHNELEDQGGVSGMRPGETLNFAPSLSKNPHIDSIYIDKPASDYRSGDQDNLLTL